MSICNPVGYDSLLVQSLKYLLRFNVRTRPVRRKSVDDNARESTADCFRCFRANIFPVVLGILDDPSLFEEYSLSLAFGRKKYG